MHILMTNYQLTAPWTGSDIYTYTVAREMVRRGHRVTVYTRYLDSNGLRLMFREAGVKVVLGIDQVDERPDVVHAHHNVMAQAVRPRFPDVPMVYVSHGVLPELEKPPPASTNVAQFVGVSEEVRGALPAGAVVVRNAVDDEKFVPDTPLHDEPRKILVISNRMPEKKRALVQRVCSKIGSHVHFVGGDTQVSQDHMPDFINWADLVISLGRGCVEAMLCGRAALVYDYQGADGLVTPENVERLAERNFSGRTYGMDWGSHDLAEAIQSYYALYGPALRAKAAQMFGVHGRVDELEAIYRTVTEGEGTDVDKVRAYTE